MSNVKLNDTVEKPINKDVTTEKDSSSSARRTSRAILEHLMTRARFYKMIENQMNR